MSNVKLIGMLINSKCSNEVKKKVHNGYLAMYKKDLANCSSEFVKNIVGDDMENYKIMLNAKIIERENELSKLNGKWDCFGYFPHALA